MKLAYTVSQTKEGYWYAHMVGYPYIPVGGSFGCPFKDTKRQALKVAAGCMGLPYEEYMKIRSQSKEK